MSARRVLYLQYTNPAAYPPVEHGARILAGAGYEVSLLGIGFRGADMVLEPHPRISMRLLRYQARGWGQKLHYVWFMLWTFGWALRWRPTWVYASDALSCPAAWTIAVFARRRVVYHEHDAPQAPGNGSPSTMFQRLVMRARAAVARRAEWCILPNEARANALAPGDRDRVLTVWNCPSRGEAEQVEGARPERAKRVEGLRVLYQGSIVPARLPLTVIQALALLPSTVSLTIAGYETAGHIGYIQTLLDAARALGLGDRVTYVGTLSPRHVLLQHCARHDVGLALVPRDTADLNEQTMVGASNKPFEYLACGVPVLVADLPDWRATYVDAGYGIVCDPSSAPNLAEALRYFLTHPAERAAMGERGRARILQDWNYETRFAPVLARLQAVTS